MLSIEKKILKVNIFGILLIILSVAESECMLKPLMFFAMLAYIFFLMNIVKLMYNRKKIVEESKCPMIVLITNVYTANIVHLSLLVWTMQQYQKNSFKGICSYFDSLYYTIITFSTVGYGDIIPETVFAKIVSILIISSNFLLLVVFVNLFVIKSKKKDDYLSMVMHQISFLFEEMSSCCGVVDSTCKELNLSWSGWVEKYIDILNTLAENYPERVEENEKMMSSIREHNSKCSFNEDIKEIPYMYINGKDQLLIEKFVYSSKKVINAIEFLEDNKISLLENENLTEHHFFILSDIKDGFEIASRHYRYGIKDGNEMMNAFKKDLYKDLKELGYQRYNEAKFCGYQIGKNRELSYALMKVDLSNKKEVFWLGIQGILDRILKI